MEHYSPTTVRRKDPALRLSGATDIKSIISRFESNVEKRRPTPRKASVPIMSNSTIEPVVEEEHSNAFPEVAENDWEVEWECERSPSYLVGITWRMLRMVLYGLCCLFWASQMSLAMIMVAIAMFGPRVITDLVVYPCCRLIFGTLYPAYGSYKAVRSKNIREYVKWMMYWIVFALFTCAETFTDVFFSWFPFYYEIKIILVFWLLSPATKGSSILYRKFVHPALCRREQEIDECIAKAKEQGYHTVLNLGSKGVNYATNVIVQTALRSGGGLVQQIRKSYSLSDLTASDDQCDGHKEVAGSNDSRIVRRAVSVRGKSPRPTSVPRVDMYFSEVDVPHNPRTVNNRDSVNLSQIRSSEDISTSHIPENPNGQDSLTRTSSIGSTRTRSKTTRNTFTSIKRPGAAEEDEIIIEEIIDDEEPLSMQADDEFSIAYKNFISSYVANNNDLKADDYLEMFKKFEEFRRLVGEIDVNRTDKKELINNATDKDNTKIQPVEPIVSENIQETNNIQCKSEDEQSIQNIVVSVENDIAQCLNSVAKETEDDLLNKSEITENEDEFLECSSINDNKENELDTLIESIIDKEKILVEKLEEFDNTLNKQTDTITLVNSKEELHNNSISDPEDVEGDFSTPKSSPVLKSKFEKSPKSKKRPAPPPPTISPEMCNSIESLESKISNDEGKLDQADSLDNIKEESLSISLTNTDRQSEVVPLNNNEGFVDNVKPENVKQIDDENVISKTTKDNIKSKHKNTSEKQKRDPISKLLHIPSKIAFWNKSEQGARHDDSNIAIEHGEFDSENNLVKSKRKSIDSITRSSSSIDNISIKSTDSKPCKTDDKATSDLSNVNNLHESSNRDSIYIPLTVENIISHMECKSTNV